MRWRWRRTGPRDSARAWKCTRTWPSWTLAFPSSTAIQVGRRLRQALGRAVTLVAYTAYEEDPEDRRAAEAGFDAWLVKPVELHVLTNWLDWNKEPA